VTGEIQRQNWCVEIAFLAWESAIHSSNEAKIGKKWQKLAVFKLAHCLLKGSQLI